MNVVFDADSILWKLDIDVSDGRADDATVIRSKRPSVPPTDMTRAPFHAFCEVWPARQTTKKMGMDRTVIPSLDYGQAEKIKTIKASLPYV